jgi:hypothetical protein
VVVKRTSGSIPPIPNSLDLFEATPWGVITIKEQKHLLIACNEKLYFYHFGITTINYI